MTQEEMLELLQAVNASRPQVTQTLNFHGPIGQQIAHVDKIEAHFDKDMGMQIIGDGGAGAKCCAPDDEEIEPVGSCLQGESLAESLKGAFYGKADVASRFLNEISGLKSTQITKVVGEYMKRRLLSELSSHRDLWQILHENGYYDPSESNWNKALRLL